MPKDKKRLSKNGQNLVEEARRRKGWNRQTPRWYMEANVSLMTLRRFQSGTPVLLEVFDALCRVVGVDPDLVAAPPSELNTDELNLLLEAESVWVGRGLAVRDLTRRLRQNCHLLTIAGITGIGKTALAEQVAQNLRETYPSPQRLNFDVHETRTGFVGAATWALEASQQIISDEAQRNAEQLMNQWVNYLVQKPHLLIIDSLELILEGDEESGWSNFRDPLWVQFFKRLLAAEICRSRVILTTQDTPAEVRREAARYSQHWYCHELTGLDQQEQLEFFQTSGLDLDESASTKDYLLRLGSAYEGHPLALQIIVGEITTPAYGGSVDGYWSKYGKEIETLEKLRQAEPVHSESDRLRLTCCGRDLRLVIQDRVDQTLNRLNQEVPKAYMMLCLNAAYRRSVPEDFWHNTMKPLGFDEYQCEIALDTLKERYLVESRIQNTTPHLRQHNLIRNIALEHLRSWRKQNG